MNIRILCVLIASFFSCAAQGMVGEVITEYPGTVCRGCASIWDAAAVAHAMCMQRLAYNVGFDANEIDANGNTILHEVVTGDGAYANKLECIEFLLQVGALSDPVDRNGCTPLSYLQDNNKELLLMLLRYDADLYRLDKNKFLRMLASSRSRGSSRPYISLNSVKNLFVRDMVVRLPRPASLVRMFANLQLNERDYHKLRLNVELLQSYRKALVKILRRLQVLRSCYPILFSYCDDMDALLCGLKTIAPEGYIEQPFVVELINNWVQCALKK